jgi:uroporphyrinogen-III decarboxylase
MEKQELLKQREERLQKAVNFDSPDRVPYTYLGPAYSAVSTGISMKEYCLDGDASLEATIGAMEKLGDVDGVNMMVGGLFPALLSFAWLSKIDIPGRDLPADVMWQVHESEVMSIDDYDMIIDKGYPAFLEYHLPKVADMSIMKANEEWFAKNITTMAGKYNDRGYAIFCGGQTTIPFEPLCGARSMPKFFVDLYRIPDKVQAALDVMQPFWTQFAIDQCNATGVRSLWVGGWRTASAMVAPKIWDRFVFPYFYDMVTKLDEENILSVLHWDQDWTRDLERLLEMPAKKCVLAPDGATDIRKAREILGDHMALCGDVPASILATGSPDDVYNYVETLIKDIGKEGLIMNSGCDIPFNAKHENVQAMVDATKEFGTL